MSNYEICEEMGQNFIDYAYAVNTDRSIPSAADGLKPVHRRILWSMYKEKNTSDKAHIKCARIVGDVIGKYHPHGDTSVYDAMTRLAQEWNIRYPLIDWHGNKGNIGGDGAAAMRYTEARLQSLAQDGMLQNLNKNVVDMQPNYSEDLEEPVLLPAIFPNLLCNPNSGIGVAMACNWLPYNLHELINQVIIPHLQGKTTDYEHLYPDFPTGGNIVNKANAIGINNTGRGSITVEGKYNIEKRGNKQLIVFYEIPYGVKIEYEEQGKAKGIIPQLRKAIAEEKILGIADVRDESSKTIRIVIELESGSDLDKTISQIYNETDLRKSFSANYVALVGKTPKLLNIHDIIVIYSQHNLECIRREYQFEYQKTIDRIEILEGLIWAVQNIDDVIYDIRQGITLHSNNINLTDRQIKAILDMKLSRLSKLEEEKLIQEKKEKEEYAALCKLMVDSEKLRAAELIKRLEKLDKKYGDNRRTTLEDKTIIKISNHTNKQKEEFIPEDVVVSINTDGYIKVVPIKSYRKNKEPYLNLFKTSTDDMLMIFTNTGRMFRIKLNQIKICGNTDKGVAIGSLISLDKNERILMISSNKCSLDYILFVTQNGMIKKTKMSEYISTVQNTRGMKAVNIRDDDSLIKVCSGLDIDDIVLLTKNGYTIRFSCDSLNYQGKIASGVKGINLSNNDYVVDCISYNQEEMIFIASANGECKLLRNESLSNQNRGGKGQKIFDSPVVGAQPVKREDEVILISNTTNTVIKINNLKLSMKTGQGENLSKKEIIDIYKL